MDEWIDEWVDGLKGIHKSVQDLDANNMSPSYNMVLNSVYTFKTA